MADRNAGNAPIVALDPRLTPARPDLAAKHLDGKVTAARFVEGELREIIEPQAAVRRAPAPDAPLDTEALKGERVMVYETPARRLRRLAARERARCAWAGADPQGCCRAHAGLPGTFDQIAAS